MTQADLDRPNIAEEIELARTAYEQRNYHAAIFHISWALNTEPTNALARDLLHKIIDAVPDALALVPLGVESTSAATAAAHAYILAERAQYDRALAILASVIRATPGVSYLPWATEWLNAPPVVKAIDPQNVGMVIIAAIQELSEPVTDPGVTTPISAFSLVVTQVRITHPETHMLAGLQSIMLRKIGRYDEAINIARTAFEAQPDKTTAVAWAMVYRVRNQLDEAIAIFRKALAVAPNDIYVMLDIADLLCEQGKLSEGVEVYEQVLAREPGQEWAEPHRDYYQYLLTGDTSWRRQLEQYVATHPDNAAALRLMRLLHTQGRAYVDYLPSPTDATIAMLRRLAEDGALHEGRSVTINLSALESPSARLAAGRFADKHLEDITLDFQVSLQRPDPRRPRKPVHFLIWTYNGTDPKPNVPPPSEEMASDVASLASETFEIEEWKRQARKIAARLGEGTITDLLAVMVHPPDNPPSIQIWDWIYRVQIAACLIVATLSSDWDRPTGKFDSFGKLKTEPTPRKKVLVSLLYGPMDWTQNAAILALFHIAQDEPTHQQDIVNMFLDIYRNPPLSGDYPYGNLLADSLLRLPMTPQVVRDQIRHQEEN